MLSGVHKQLRMVVSLLEYVARILDMHCSLSLHVDMLWMFKLRCQLGFSSKESSISKVVCLRNIIMFLYLIFSYITSHTHFLYALNLSNGWILFSTTMDLYSTLYLLKFLRPK